MKEIYHSSTDAGLHAAAEWLLRAWGESGWLKSLQDQQQANLSESRLPGILEDFAKNQDYATPQWYQTTQGQTMVAIPGPIQFTMGSPESEFGRLGGDAEKPTRVTIPRTFAISSKLTTVAQFDRFDGGTHSSKLPKDFSVPDKPVVRATWYQVAEYCDWLSEKENITPDQWCYITEPKSKRVIGVKPNYLELTGYRLPTEAEYEYANRAGATTCRYFGETEDLLGDYAWYEKNSEKTNSRESTHPVGTRKPNDFGCFDMQGNAFSWCHNWLPDKAGPRPTVDRSLPDPGNPITIDGQVLGNLVVEKNKRALRGGAFYFMAISLRAARPHDDVPTMQGLYYSFRVARTLK